MRKEGRLSFYMTKKALSRTGLEPALSGPDFNLSDRDLKKKEEKELMRFGACLLTKPLAHIDRSLDGTFEMVQKPKIES